MVIENFFRPELSDLRPYSVKHCPHTIKLDANENPFNIPEKLINIISQKALEFSFNRYPDADAKILRNKLSEFLDIPFESICVGNGSDELINYIMTIFARNDARVVYPTPTFSMYEIIARSAGLEVNSVSLTDDFKIDLPQLLDSLNNKGSNLIFLSYPNNPTGNCFDKDVILELLEHSNTLVIMDEAYHEFSGKTFLPYIEHYPNLIVTRTFSKAYSLAGLRVGYMVADRKIIREINKIRLPYNLNGFSQFVACTVLENVELLEPIIKKIINERARIYKELIKLQNVKPFPTDANFILMRFADSDKLFNNLISNGILIRNLNQPGILRNCLRVCVGKPEENEAFLSRLKSNV